MWPFVTDRVAWPVSLSVCDTSEPYQNSWTDSDTIWIVGSDGPKESGVRWGPELPIGRGNFWGKGRPLKSIGTVCYELCKNGWTDRVAIWDLDSGGPKEAYIRWGSRSPCEGATFRGRTCPSYLRTVCSNCLSCRILNFNSSHYLISMQPIKCYGITV